MRELRVLAQLFVLFEDELVGDQVPLFHRSLQRCHPGKVLMLMAGCLQEVELAVECVHEVDSNFQTARRMAKVRSG